MESIDERRYEELASQTFRMVLDMFEDVDPDELDVEQAGDVMTLVTASGQKLVLNTQRPARQLWLAGGREAWHFSYDVASGSWRDDKRPDTELMSTLCGLVRELAGVAVEPPPV